MRPLLVLIFFGLTFLGCNSARVIPPPPPPTKKDYNPNCYHNGKLSDAARRSIYPFNKAEKIKVVSFDSVLDKTPILNDTLVISQTKEVVDLSDLQISRLTDILFNYNYSKRTRIVTETKMGCYYPRHAILFLDKSGKVISYIEICLECKEVRTALPEESLGVFCDGKYELIKHFFQSCGITFFKDEINVD